MSLADAIEKAERELKELPAHYCHPTVAWCIQHIAAAARAEINAVKIKVAALEQRTTKRTKETSNA